MLKTCKSKPFMKTNIFRFQSVDPQGTVPEPRHTTQSGSRFLGHPFFGSRFSRFRFGSGIAFTTKPNRPLHFQQTHD